MQQEAQFSLLVAGMRAGLCLADRMQRRVPFFKCFVGAELVDYLVRELSLEGRPAAVSAKDPIQSPGVLRSLLKSLMSFNDPIEIAEEF